MAMDASLAAFQSEGYLCFGAPFGKDSYPRTKGEESRGNDNFCGIWE